MPHKATKNASAIALALAAGISSPALAQSDPSLFDSVFNVGTVTPGSIFDILDDDIPGTLTNATTVGDGTPANTGTLTPTFLQGDLLAATDQLNLFDNGTILAFFRVNGEMNILGGSVGQDLAALAGSTVNISGGNVGQDLNALTGSTVNISGGTVGDEFTVNGASLNISAGNIGNNFTANSGDINITGGSFGSGFSVDSGADINIAGGTFGAFFRAESSSTVNITGGLFNDSFNAGAFSTINISGGDFDLFEFQTALNTTVNISGGTINGLYEADSASTTNISGGSVAQGTGARFVAGGEAEINLFGTSFLLNGTDVTPAQSGQTVIIDDRNIPIGGSLVLSGTLVDGSPFSFNLNAFIQPTPDDVFPTTSTVTITLEVPCPTDLDDSGETGLGDLLIVLNAFGVSSAGDTNDDDSTGLVDLLAILAAFGTPCP